MVDISIIIPFRNELQQLNRCIQGILNQKIELKYEIVILDSSDIAVQNEIQILSPKINYYRILPESYNHGLTRNKGVKFAKGNIIVFTVQDSIAADSLWLNHLIKPLLEYNLDAICGKQISNPHDDTNPIGWHRPIDLPNIRFVDLTSELFNSLESHEKKIYTGWDNVNSAYLKDSLIKIPFREMMFGEDAQWSVDAINGNLKLAYNSFALVFHDHPFNYDFAFKRTLAEFYTRKKTINLDPTPPVININTMLIWIYLLFRSTHSPFKTIYWFRISLMQYIAERTAYYNWVTMGFSQVEDFLTNDVPMSKR